jgi:hypothetical protein
MCTLVWGAGHLPWSLAKWTTKMSGVLGDDTQEEFGAVAETLMETERQGQGGDEPEVRGYRVWSPAGG